MDPINARIAPTRATFKSPNKPPVNNRTAPAIKTGEQNSSRRSPGSPKIIAIILKRPPTNKKNTKMTAIIPPQTIEITPPAIRNPLGGSVSS